MANPQKPAPVKTTAPTPAPAPTPNGNGMSAAKAKSTSTSPAAQKGDKLRYYSAVEPTYTFRILKSLVEKFGPPEHKGQPMVQRSGGGDQNALKALREAREAKLAAMTEEQKVAFLKTEKEERKAKKASKKQAEYDAIVAKVKADMAAGKL